MHTVIRDYALLHHLFHQVLSIVSLAILAQPLYQRIFCQKCWVESLVHHLNSHL